jgi:predicted nucleic acid-binding Zn ribbon protein
VNRSDLTFFGILALVLLMLALVAFAYLRLTGVSR